MPGLDPTDEECGIFPLYDRLFKGRTVGECLVHQTTGVFLKEGEFMDRYRSDLADEQKRVWNSGCHQQLRAFFSA